MSSAQTAVAETSENRRRRRLIPVVDPRFQWKYTLIITGIGVGIVAVMGWFLYSAHRNNTRLLDLAADPALQQEVLRNDQIFLIALLVAAVFMAVALGFWGLVVTHRISGPLYIVARHLNAMSEGRFPDLRPLRKSDELRDFFAAFEDAISTMRRRDEQALASIQSTLEQLQELGESDPRAGLERAVETLKQREQELQRALEETQ